MPWFPAFAGMTTASDNPGMAPSPSQVIVFANQKGGCGKTSTTVATAGAFASLGYSVCVIDTDPEWLETLVALAIDPSIGAACSAPDDSPFTPGGDLASVQAETTTIAGSCVAIRREVWAEVGGLGDDPTGFVVPAALTARGWTCIRTPFVRLRRHHADRPFATT